MLPIFFSVGFGNVVNDFIHVSSFFTYLTHPLKFPSSSVSSGIILFRESMKLSLHVACGHQFFFAAWIQVPRSFFCRVSSLLQYAFPTNLQVLLAMKSSISGMSRNQCCTHVWGLFVLDVTLLNFVHSKDGFRALWTKHGWNRAGDAGDAHTYESAVYESGIQCRIQKQTAISWDFLKPPDSGGFRIWMKTSDGWIYDTHVVLKPPDFDGFRTCRKKSCTSWYRI